MKSSLNTSPAPTPTNESLRGTDAVSGKCGEPIQLSTFIGAAQRTALESALGSEEQGGFVSMLARLNTHISGMPRTYATEDIDDPMVGLHYFYGGSDWYIVELDSEPAQNQAFGWVTLNGWPIEAGYISIMELVQNNVELDLYWTPVPVSVIRAKHEQ